MEQFTELSLILIVTLVVSSFMRFLKQPLLIGYVITGLLVGPYGLNILHSVEMVELFSDLGITALLFIVGLGLSPKVLKELGLISSITGTGQVIFTSLFGYLIALVLGFSTIESLYVAIALTFSSTIIILKLLSDKGDTQKLYGKISIGFLLVQDLIATVILIGITGFTALEGNSLTVIASTLSLMMIKGLLLLLFLFFLATKVLSRFENFIAKSQEYLFISSVAWGMAVAMIYSKLGLSIEIGALVAGVTLAMTPYAHEIASKLKPLRDFFITLFFILLGYQMVFDNWQSLITPTAIFSLFVLIGNPIIVLMLMNLLGYTKKTGFMAGLTVAQISEFSLILIKLGFDVGHLSKDILSMVTMVGIFTIAGSTYLIIYAEKVFEKLEKFLSIFELRKNIKIKHREPKEYEAIIFGYRRAGPEFAHAFKNSKTKFLVIDFNPDTIHKLEKAKIDCEYGDASDLEFLQELPLRETKIIISTIPEYETNILITQAIRRTGSDALIIIITDTMEHAMKLYDSGATNVILSYYLGANHAAQMIQKNGFDHNKYEKIKKEHVEYLNSIKDFAFQS